MSTLTVRNMVQRVLFVNELKGQISDGHWENARPVQHWIPWCYANVIVDPQKVGRDFWCNKSNYNFTDPLLLDAVGDRMLFMAKFAFEFPATVGKIIDNEGSHFLPEDVEHFQRCAMYDPDKMQRWIDYGINQYLLECVETSKFSLKDLKKELQDLKKIIKILI